MLGCLFWTSKPEKNKAFEEQEQRKKIDTFKLRLHFLEQ